MYRKSDQLLESSTQAVGAASKHELHTKSSRLPEISGKKSNTSTKEGSSFKAPGQAQLQNKVSISKSRFGPDNSEILTTDTSYYSSVADSVVERELVDGTEVPGTGLNAMIFIISIMFLSLVSFVSSGIGAPHGPRTGEPG